MIINYLIGVVTGCAAVVTAYILILSKQEQVQKKTKEKLATENRGLKNDLKIEITRNRNSINTIEEEIEAIKLRQDQADLWFGSIIRHSRAQFDKEAVEKFIEEHGMEEEL